VLGRRVVAILHGIVEAIPVVKTIYSTVRSAVELLSTPKTQDRPYGGVVLLDFPRRGLKSIGLVTAHLGVQNGEEMLAVYVPSSPVPSTGFLVMVAAKDTISTQMTMDDALRALVSGGILAKDLYIPSSYPNDMPTHGEHIGMDKVNFRQDQGIGGLN